MTVTTVAGTELAISATTPALQTQASYAGLAFTEIGGVEKIGTAGAVYGMVDFRPLKGPAQKRKGGPDYGALAPSIAVDESDAGQALLRTAADDTTSKLYAFRVTYPTGAIRYFQGRVFGFGEAVDGSDTVVTAAPTIEINTQIIRVPPPGTIPNGAILNASGGYVRNASGGYVLRSFT